MVQYRTNAIGLPVPPSMDASSKSMAKCICMSTRDVTREVVRLWARASNGSFEAAVSRASSVAMKAFGMWGRDDDALYEGMSALSRREHSLLTIMGLVFPGSGSFIRGGGYALFPRDAGGVDSHGRQHPFGILADRRSFHVFVDMQDFRAAARAINPILQVYAQVFRDFRLYVHISHEGVEPGFHLGVHKRWPLAVLPSAIGYWRVGVRRNGHPDLVKMFDPDSTRLDRHSLLPVCSNWASWLSACVMVQDDIMWLMARVRRAVVLDESPADGDRRERRQSPRSMPGISATPKYASITSVLRPTRGTPRSVPQPTPRKAGVGAPNSAGVDGSAYIGGGVHIGAGSIPQMELTPPLVNPDPSIRKMSSLGPNGVSQKSLNTNSGEDLTLAWGGTLGPSVHDALKMIENRGGGLTPVSSEVVDEIEDDALLALLHRLQPDGG